MATNLTGDLAGTQNGKTPAQLAAGNTSGVGIGSPDPTLSTPTNQTTTGNAYNLSATPGASGRSLYDPASATNLSNSLETSFEGSNPYQSILSTYNNALADTSGQYQAAGQQLGTQYGQDIQQQGQSNRIALDNTMTSRGLATNSALLAQQQDQADYRIKNLRDQMDAALASNNTAAASKLADLATQEQSTITAARTSFLSNYFNTQTEARAQASFQTPEQQSVLALAGQYPDAGITAGDTLADAQKKVSGSTLYQKSLASTGASTAAALAAAGASGASATQTKVLTNLMQNGGGSDSEIVRALSNGDMQLADLTTVINSAIDPQGIKRITNEYLVNGGSPAANAAAYAAKLEHARSLGGGGYGAASTGVTDTLGSFLGGAFGSNPLSASSAADSQSLSPGLNPKPGDARMYNGLMYTWTGSVWKKG